MKTWQKKIQSYSGDLEDQEKKLIAWFCSFQQFATKPVKNNRDIII
jgi:hypothetical protein